MWKTHSARSWQAMAGDAGARRAWAHALRSSLERHGCEILRGVYDGRGPYHKGILEGDSYYLGPEFRGPPQFRKPQFWLGLRDFCWSCLLGWLAEHLATALCLAVACGCMCDVPGAGLRQVRLRNKLKPKPCWFLAEGHGLQSGFLKGNGLQMPDLSHGPASCDTLVAIRVFSQRKGGDPF